MIGKALLLVGSPRGGHSNSLVLGTYLADRLAEKGVQIETLHVNRLAETEEGRQKLLGAVDAADLLLLAFPLYIDCLPAPLIRALQTIHEHRKAHPGNQKIMALVNCGLPEPHQNQVAIDICRQFAAEAGLEWLGSARIGSGMAIGGRRLEEAGGVTARLRKGLDRAADLLAEGKPLTPEVEKKLYLPLMPVSVARILMVNWKGLWDRQASPQALKHMYDRPYQE